VETSGNDGRISLFTLDFVDNEIVEANGRSDFDLNEYGRLKYCDSGVADRYGVQMAHTLMRHCPEMLRNFYVAASGFKYVPSAAHSLLSPLVAELALHGCAPTGFFRIDRGIVKAIDYSTLSFTERVQSNSGRRVSIPDVSSFEISGRNVIVIDDIRISGQTEDETRRALLHTAPANVLYLYVAMLTDELGKTNSSIEHRLTHAAVSCLADLVPIVESDAFVLNARTCKFILRAPVGEVVTFARKVSRGNLKRILSAMIADGYHLMPGHQMSFAALLDVMR
jgi:hypothetical protein